MRHCPYVRTYRIYVAVNRHAKVILHPESRLPERCPNASEQAILVFLSQPIQRPSATRDNAIFHGRLNSAGAIFGKFAQVRELRLGGNRYPNYTILALQAGEPNIDRIGHVTVGFLARLFEFFDTTLNGIYVISNERTRLIGSEKTLHDTEILYVYLILTGKASSHFIKHGSLAKRSQVTHVIVHIL